MIREAIILAGGLGTRLRTVVFDKPKCMAPVNGKPFLNYLIHFLKESGIEKFVFSVGYRHEAIADYLAKDFASLNYKLSVESEPLGTGGAIKLSCNQTSERHVLVCNGDTLFKIDLVALSNFHKRKNARCSLCLRPMENFDRYGVVELNDNEEVKSFKEKKYYKSGLINGGVYGLDVAHFTSENFPEKFSFEKDYLEKKTETSESEKPTLFGLVQDKYFIDIGIPEDYDRAGKEF